MFYFWQYNFKLYGITRSYSGCLFLCALGMTVLLAKSIYHTISAHRHVFTIEVLVCVCGTLIIKHTKGTLLLYSFLALFSDFPLTGRAWEWGYSLPSSKHMHIYHQPMGMVCAVFSWVVVWYNPMASQKCVQHPTQHVVRYCPPTYTCPEHTLVDIHAAVHKCCTCSTENVSRCIKVREYICYWSRQPERFTILF